MRGPRIAVAALLLFAACVLPAVAALPDPGSGWSAVYVQNIDPVDTSTVQMYFYNPDGSLAAPSPYSVGDIPPKGMRIIRSDIDFPTAIGSGWTGSVELQSSTPLAALTLLYWDNATTNSHTLGVYTGEDAPGNKSYLPYLAARGELQTSRVVVQNTSDAAAKITIFWYDRDGKENASKRVTTSIPAKGEQTFDVGVISPFERTMGLGSAFIESDQPIATAATMHFGSMERYSSDAYSGVTTGDTVLWIPSVFRMYNDTCGNPATKLCYRSYNIVSVQNLGDLPAEVSIDFFRYDGVHSLTVTDTIQPKAARAYNTAMQALLPDKLWGQIEAGLGLEWRGTMRVECTNGQPLAGVSSLFPSGWYNVPDCLMYPAIRDNQGTSNALSFPLAYRKLLLDGTLNQWSTSIVQNLTSTDATLTVEAYDAIAGAPVASWQMPIPADGTLILNTKTPMANGFSQAQLDQLGTSFAGAIYVTPPKGSGIRIVGNTQMYWMIAGRAGAYPGMPVQ